MSYRNKKMSAQTVRAITGDTFYGLRRQSQWSYMIFAAHPEGTWIRS